jgi:hypothetical protein
MNGNKHVLHLIRTLLHYSNYFDLLLLFKSRPT